MEDARDHIVAVLNTSQDIVEMLTNVLEEEGYRVVSSL